MIVRSIGLIRASLGSACAPKSASTYRSLTFCRPQLGDYEYYRHAVDAYARPETQGQRRLAATIERSIVNILNLDVTFKGQLIERHGMAVHKVHLTRDRQQVHIRWDCFPSQARQCTEDLQRLKPKIRTALARVMDMKRVPTLEFSRDVLTPTQARAAAILDGLQGEEQEREGGEREGGPAEPEVVDAALASLHSRMRLKMRMRRTPPVT